jgi:hypothetical protein
VTRIGSIVGLALALAACRADPVQATAPPVAPIAPSASWDGAASTRAPVSSAVALTKTSPEALAELVAAASAAPRAEAPRAAIGSDVPTAASAEARATTKVSPPPTSVDARPPPNQDALARAERAELDWPLTQRCRDEAGALLPPGAVEVLFKIDEDGHILPATVVTMTGNKRFDKAALCMRRELAKSGFHVPPGARGNPIRLVVPPVD